MQVTGSPEAQNYTAISGETQHNTQTQEQGVAPEG
jgi:hypothetical protein